MGSLKEDEPRKRRVFTDEFKQDAVRLVTTGGYTFAAAAKSLGIGEQSLRHWHAKFAPPTGRPPTVASQRPWLPIHQRGVSADLEGLGHRMFDEPHRLLL